MKSKRSRLFIFNVRIVLVVGLSILLAVPSAIIAADDSVELISSRSDPGYEALKSDTRVWTLERMKNAKPYPMPAVWGNPQAEVAGQKEPDGVPGLIPSGASGQEYSLPDVLDNIETFPLGYSYPPPLTRYENFNSTGADKPYDGYKKYPYRTVGVLFFKQNGIDYRCSAASIGNYAIWTAGHCVSDGAGNWSSNFTFLPAYKDGSPAVSWAVWSGSIAWTFNGWHLNGDFCRDSGGVVLNLNSTGKKVSYVGWLGFAWNFPRDQHWHEIGYPSAAPFDGNKQIICASSHSTDDDPCVSPLTIGVGCDQTPGCSGGPWIKNFSGQSGSSNYLNGNFSYHYVGKEDEKFSPYFDDASKSLWDTLVGDTP